MSDNVEFSATIVSCPRLYRTWGGNAGICAGVGGGGGGAGEGGGSGAAFFTALAARFPGTDC
jgi:hypothetical protein